MRSALNHPLDSIELSVKATNYPVTGRVFVNNYHPARKIVNRFELKVSRKHGSGRRIGFVPVQN